MNNTIKLLSEKYVNDVYDGDTDFSGEAENVLTWLFKKTLWERLTDTEKAQIRDEYSKTFPDENDRDITSLVAGNMLERIFGLKNLKG